ncbi:hypothetical protein [Pontibacter pudoricolor]|uniref:hypothetical protein n=1 Tax=Pontibacter pudoricolor TaxID=2694930 RepID=UPI001391A63E|nr:hypothetical protein [Pontibacter pudoricolor]
MRFLYTFILVIGLIQIEIKFILYNVIKAKGRSHSFPTMAPAFNSAERMLLFLALAFTLSLTFSMSRVCGVWMMGVVWIFVPAFVQTIILPCSARITDSNRFAVNYYNLPRSAAGCFFRG